MYQNIQLLIRNKIVILNTGITILKYSLHKFRETVLHQKCQLIQT